MEPEYDIRGGVRGKYFQKYHESAGASVVIRSSAALIEITAGAPPGLQGINRSLLVRPVPSPEVQIGQPQ
jgi:hypothetical protein